MQSYMQQREEYPKEYFVPLSNEPYFLGRIIVNKMKSGFQLDIDIVNKETLKIYHHLGQLFGEESEEEAIRKAVQKISKK